MAKLSARSAFPPSESLLDVRLCAEVGAELERVREARGLSLAEVGDKLLLSVRQVRALEEVDVAAFHNAAFQLKALRKYAQFAGLDPVVVSKLSAALMSAEPDSTTPSGTLVTTPHDEPRRGLRAVASVLAVAAIAAVGFYALRTRSVAGPGTGVVVAAQVPAPAVPPAAGDKELPPSPAPPADPTVDIPQPQAPAMAATRMPTAFGSVRVTQPTWLFIRYAEGTVIERNLAAGELLELETQPTYLAIGVSDPELVIANAPVDVARFVVNGQVRIRAGDFDALVQGASPIQAPTAAATR